MFPAPELLAMALSWLPARVLLIDEGHALEGPLTAALQGTVSFRLETAVCGPEALVKLASANAFDLVVTPWATASTNGRELLTLLRRQGGAVPVLVLVERAQVPEIPTAMSLGAASVLVAPPESEALRDEVRALLGIKPPIERLPQLNCAFQCIVGHSPPIQSVLDLIDEVAPSNANVLVLGATGTGKELIARAVHCKSERRLGPFVAVNCSAIPEGLIESELFGHRRGAFTGAVADHRGVFEAATGGTLFLDEIGDLAPAVQVKLLRVVQERRIHPVGAEVSQPVDVRIVAATHRPLTEMVADGRFREDLYYRLAVIEMELPPLRERAGDIVPLAEYFLQRVAGRLGRTRPRLAPETVALLSRYPWPGNVRELENAMERAVLLTRGDEVQPAALPARIRQAAADSGADPLADWPTLEALERRYIEQVLARTGGHRTEAARLLGVDRKTLYRKLQQFDLDLPEPSDPACPSDPAADGG